MKFKYNKKHLPYYIVGGILLLLLLVPSGKKADNNPLNASVTMMDLKTMNAKNQDKIPVKSEEQKKLELCGNLDTAKLIIKLKFSLGYDKEPSYDTGIAYTLTGAKKEMRLTRLARTECQYQVGFSQDELKDIKDARVVVYGYQDALPRRFANGEKKLKLIAGEPIDNRIVEVTLSK